MRCMRKKKDHSSIAQTNQSISKKVNSDPTFNTLFIIMSKIAPAKKTIKWR